MKDDLVKQLGYANLDTRLKRISDKITHSLRSMYRDLEIDTEPNWYLVFLLVSETPGISVMEIAQRLRFTHQSIMAMTNKMIQSGYLISEKDAIDKRKTVFFLTDKAKKNLPLYTRIWEIGKEVIFELLDQNVEIMDHLDRLESNLQKASFGQRIATVLSKENSNNT